MDFHERVRSPAQAQMYKIIAGAVLNAAQAHPKWKLDRRFTRSIAKRAAGTLTAQWPEVLAAKLPSDGEALALTTSLATSLRAYDHLKLGLHGNTGNPRAGGASGVSRRSPTIKYAQQAIGEMAGQARKAGMSERAEAIADVLRLLAEMEKADTLPSRWPVPELKENEPD